MLVLKHWKCIDASISSEGGNQYEKQALSRRQAALKKRLSLIYRVYLQEDAVLESCFWRRGFLEGIASGACARQDMWGQKKVPGVFIHRGETWQWGGEKESKKRKTRDKETKRQGDKARESKREIRTCSDWSINWNIQLLNKQHLFHCKAASR